jgi:hypothetical protein
MFKSIYLCPLCGKKYLYDAPNYGFDKEYMPTGPIFAPHKCADGRQGMGLIQGTIEVKESEIDAIFEAKL